MLKKLPFLHVKHMQSFPRSMPIFLKFVWYTLQLVETVILSRMQVHNWSRFIILYTFCVERKMHVLAGCCWLSTGSQVIAYLWSNHLSCLFFLLNLPKPPDSSQITLSILCQGLLVSHCYKDLHNVQEVASRLSRWHSPTMPVMQWAYACSATCILLFHVSLPTKQEDSRV